MPLRLSLIHIEMCIRDRGAAVIIICPMLFSLGTALGLKPLHLGVVMCINLVLGNVTPPFGYNLFTASSITGLKFNEIVKGIFPFLLVEIVLLLDVYKRQTPTLPRSPR